MTQDCPQKVERNYKMIYLTDVTDRACACLKSVLRIDVDKDHRTSNWVLILYLTCTTIALNWKWELKIVYSGDLNCEMINWCLKFYQIINTTKHWAITGKWHVCHFKNDKSSRFDHVTMKVLKITLGGWESCMAAILQFDVLNVAENKHKTITNGNTDKQM